MRRRVVGSGRSKKMMSCREPSYQALTNARNVSTPYISGSAKLASQSTASPRNCRARASAASLAYCMAMVTPEDNTGSRNSAALPSNAKPLPCNALTRAA